MEGLELFHAHEWHPLAAWGLTSPWFAVYPETIIYTWIALVILFIVAIVARIALRYHTSISGYIVILYVQSFMDMVSQSFPQVIFNYYVFAATIFTFIFICNILVLLPGLEEPTADLNTTFALALITFFYVQKESIKAHGLIGYLHEYFKTPLTVNTGKPLTVIEFTIRTIKVIINIVVAIALFPLELLGKFASVISLSFRLYGNIFGGSVISALWKSFIARSVIFEILALGFNIIIALFFGLFEGFIQALVFTILSLTYLAMGTQHNTDEQVI